MNPRDGYPPYALSRGASSANLSTSPQPKFDSLFYFDEKASLFFSKPAFPFGGETEIRTLGSFESLVFKTSSLNHSDISPYRERITLYQIFEEMSIPFGEFIWFFQRNSPKIILTLFTGLYLKSQLFWDAWD